MGYERNDRRYGGYSPDRERSDYGAYRGRQTSYGYGSRDYRGDRFDDRDDRFDDRDNDPRDRGFLDRAGDEVRSWFGDEEAERRRREDVRYDERHRSYGSGAYDDYRSNDDYGYRGNSDRDYARGSSSYSAPYGGRPANTGRHDYSRGPDRERFQADHGYHSWRDRQIDALDRDYHEYRRENQSRFDQEFGSWRTNRQGQRDQLSRVQEHQEVVGSDGQHVGTVDHVRGDRLLLTKQDSNAGGHHHTVPSSWIQSVDDKVTLTKTADQAKQHWRDEDRNRGGLWNEDSSYNLNRSFSGTY